MNDFSERVFQVVREIPRGKVTNYGFVAFAAGKPRASRGVGFVLHRNTDPVNTPCHRVVFKDGSLCKGYVFGGPDVQREKLKSEGILEYLMVLQMVRLTAKSTSVNAGTTH